MGLVSSAALFPVCNSRGKPQDEFHGSQSRAFSRERS